LTHIVLCRCVTIHTSVCVCNWHDK
jgi:hypothetical protein